MQEITDDTIRLYEPLVKNLAKKFVGRNGAEFDDLVQEGLIDVWMTLAQGKRPHPEYIQLRMSRYCKWLGKYCIDSYRNVVEDYS